MNGTEASREALEIEKKYEQWLEMGGLTDRSFLSYRTVADFTILSGESGDYKIIAIGHAFKGVFTRIGEQLAYKKNDLEGFENLSLLLLFMAQKLDMANEKAPKFEQRPKYFYEKVKAFIKGAEEYKRLQAQPV